MIVYEDVIYDFDGQPMHGRIYRDDAATGRSPGVLVLPEGLGVSQFTWSSAERLASLGYVAIAADLYGGGYYREDLADAETQRRYAQVANSSEQMCRVGRSGLAVLRARSDVDSQRMGAIGYCFGASIALNMAFAAEPLRAVVGFHPGFGSVSAEGAEKYRGRILVCCGAQDPFGTDVARADFCETLERAGVAWEMHLYGGARHSFTKPDAQGDPLIVAYNPAADKSSWAAATRLLADCLS